MIRSDCWSKWAALDALFEDAASSGFVTRTPADRLRFFAGASHALRLGSRNSCGFFATVVRRGLWHVISQTDEDHAIKQLRANQDAAFSQRTAPGQQSGASSFAARRNASGEVGVPGIQSLVASLVVRCSMDKIAKVGRECRNDRSPGSAPAARDPVGLARKDRAERAGEGRPGGTQAPPADGLPKA